MHLFIRRHLVKTALSLMTLAALPAHANERHHGASEPSIPAMSQFHATVREAAPGLPGYTVYRPAQLDRFKPKSMPVVVWANGGCRPSNMGVTSFLTLIAARGFIVIANGDFDAPSLPGAGVQPQLLVAAIDWATRKRAPLQNRVDPEKVAVMGRSCGGLEALVAGSDPRVKSVVALHTGFFPTPTNGYGREWLARLHTPALIVNGGPTDSAYQNSIENFNLMMVPAVLVEHSKAGHNGTTLGINNGLGDEALMIEGVKLAVQWLDFTLNGQTSAAGHVLGAQCTLCTKPDWKVWTKGF